MNSTSHHYLSVDLISYMLKNLLSHPSSTTSIITIEVELHTLWQHGGGTTICLNLAKRRIAGCVARRDLSQQLSSHFISRAGGAAHCGSAGPSQSWKASYTKFSLEMSSASCTASARLNASANLPISVEPKACWKAGSGTTGGRFSSGGERCGELTAAHSRTVRSASACGALLTGYSITPLCFPLSPPYDISSYMGYGVDLPSGGHT